MKCVIRHEPDPDPDPQDHEEPLSAINFSISDHLEYISITFHSVDNTFLDNSIIDKYFYFARCLVIRVFLSIRALVYFPMKFN